MAKHLSLGKSGDAKAELKNIFLDLFKGIVTLPGEYSIKLKKDTKPVHLLARHVSEALVEPLKRESWTEW